MIKIFSRFFLSALLITSVWACEDGVSDSALSINGGAKFLSLDGLARTGKISVQALASWQVTTNPSDTWFSLSATSGPAGSSEIEVRLNENAGEAHSAILIFSSGDVEYQFTLSQSAQNLGFDAPDYYFYVNFGTMPTLYAGLHLLSHDKPSYVFYERSKTFNAAEFPSRATVMLPADPTANATSKDEEKMRTQMKRRIMEINATDPTAVFGLYVDDLRCRIGYDWFVAQGIDSARVKVSLLSDGTATYNNFFNYFGDAASAEQNWNQYAKEVEKLDWNHGDRYPQTRSIPEFESHTWPYYMSTRPDYRLVVQDKSLLETTSSFMEEKLTEMDIESVKPYELLMELPEPAKKQFYRMAMFDYDKFAAMFADSPKKNLIIIGTSHSNGDSEKQQLTYVRKVVDKYGSEYDIFFKPHPADLSSAEYEGKFPGLKLLPGQMPFEIFVWALIDHIDAIGGYPSTVFITVPLDKVEFIFASNAASLVRPLNLLFKDAQDIDWIQ